MNVGLVIAMGASIVFVGLLCIVVLCKIMSAFVEISEKNAAASVPVDTVSEPVATPVTADPGPRGEIVAAIAAVLAEELGEDISAIRILSLKKIN